MLAARGVTGVFVPSLDRAETVEEFGWGRFSVVSFLQENFVLPSDAVRPDLFEMMFGVWRRARATGPRRIGVVIPSSTIAKENELLLSACAYHQRELAEVVPVLILQPDAKGETEHYAAETVAWWRRWKPDVVIGKTEGALWALQEAGVSCTVDYRFMTLRRHPGGQAVEGYDWPWGQLAEALMERMHALVSLGVRGQRETPGTWMIAGKWRGFTPGSVEFDLNNPYAHT